MSIKETSQTGQPQNFSQLINKGTSIKDILHKGGQTIAKMQAMTNQQFQIIDLPSQGWTYPKDSVLSTGRIKLKIPTGRNQAILSSQNLIKKGIMIDQFLKSLILQDFKLEDLLMGDKNYLTFVSRRMAFGNDYKVQIQCPKCGNITDVTIDLSKIQLKETPELFAHEKETNQFEYTLPISKKIVRFKLSNGYSDKIIEKRILAANVSQIEILIRTAGVITYLDGETQFAQILQQLQDISSKDTLALRIYIQKLSPDINIKYTHECSKCYRTQEVMIPITVDFFWPGNQ